MLLTDLRFGPWGLFAWVDVILIVWFVLALGSAAYVAWDTYRNNPEMAPLPHQPPHHE